MIRSINHKCGRWAPLRPPTPAAPAHRD